MVNKIDEWKVRVLAHSPTIVMLTETWLREGIDDSIICLDGYSIFRVDRPNQKGGGTCIFVKNQIDGHNLSCILAQNYQTDAPVDAVWLDVRIDKVKIIVACIYRPGNTTTEQANTQLIHTICNAFATKIPTFIFGDFNYPNINWENLTVTPSDKKTQDFVDMYCDSNSYQLINFPTRYRNDQSSLLDLFLCSDPKSVFDLKSEAPIGRSDHVIITAKTHLRLPPKPTKKVLRRNFHTAKYDKINNFIRQQQPTRVQNKFDSFETALNEAVRIHIPLRSIKINHQKPWITQNLFREIDRKRKLWDAYRKNRTQDCYQAYMSQNNALKQKLEEARTAYEHGLVQSESPKRIYKYISRNLNCKVTTVALEDPITHEILDSGSMAEKFAEQFNKSFTPHQNHPLPQLPACTRVGSSITTVQFTEEKVKETLKSMKKDSSPGPDGFPTILLQNCSDSIGSWLADAMQECMELGRIPERWKLSIVTPLFKKGDRHQPENYRPISLTCNPLKCMEKIMTKELTDFFFENDLIPLSQHGFLPKRSTTTNLLECLNDWTENHDNSQPTDVIYLDYEKAFDKVPHDLLLGKLEHYGVRGQLLTLIANMLGERYYQVRVNGEMSSKHIVSSGVIQGSVLGPLLFTSYLFDLVDHIETHMKNFADDGKLYANPTLSAVQLQEDLKNVEEWSRLWGMRLNESKCTVLRIGPNNPKQEYSLNNTILSSVAEQNDLGVTITSDLKWESHIAKIAKKANSFVYLIKHAFRDHSVKMIAKLYKSYIRPKLEYAFAVWNPYYIKDIERLEKIQRRVTKIPPELQNLPYPERLARFQITTLKERRHRGDLIETYKITSGYYNCAIANIFHQNHNQQLRGHSKKLDKEKAAKLQRKNYLSNRIVYSWNALSEDTVTATTINVFKNRVDRELRNSAARMIHYSA